VDSDACSLSAPDSATASAGANGREYGKKFTITVRTSPSPPSPPSMPSPPSSPPSPPSPPLPPSSPPSLPSLQPVDLGTSANFVILSKTGISTVPNSVVTGDIGVSPIAALAITGFDLIADSTNTFSTSSPQVTGRCYAADYKSPTPSIMTTAVSDMETAYTDAAGRSTTTNTDDQIYSNFMDGLLTGQTLTPGVYSWNTHVSFSGQLFFAGSDTDVFILQTSGSILAAAAARIVLQGGAQAHNIFWQAAGAVEAGTTSHLEGVFIVATRGVFKTGSSLNGRILAQTAVTLDQATITQA